MRIKITIDAKNMTIPRNYLHMIQGIIYDSLPREYANDLHEDKKFKLFNFSLLRGDYIPVRLPNENTDLLVFLGTAELYISSVKKEFIMMLLNSFSNYGYLRFGNYLARIITIEEDVVNISEDEINVSCLSPVTIHKTVDDKTIYYNPYDEEFFDAINVNFSKKLKEDNDHLLAFSNVNNVTKVLAKYKSFIIEAYKFDCTIKADKKYLKVIMSLGLGARNSYGFGMLRINNKRKY